MLPVTQCAILRKWFKASKSRLQSLWL